MFEKHSYSIFLFALVCSINITGSLSNPLQHLSDIDLSYISAMGREAPQESEPPIMAETDIDGIEADTSKVTTEQVSPIITGLLNTMGTSLAPLLGPLAPLSTIIGPMVNNAVTDLVTNAINGLLGSMNKDALGQMSGYESYVINIPNQGSFLLLSKPSHSPQFNGPAQAESLYSNVMEDGMANRPFVSNYFASPALPTVSAIPVTNTLLDNLKGVGHLANVNRPIVHTLAALHHKKKFRKKPQNFLIPLNHLKAANGNLNSFTQSRSSSPLTDYQLEVY